VSDFIKCLLKNVIQQMPIPHGTSSAGLNSQKSLISSVASGLWSVMTLGYGSSGSPQPPVTLTTSNQSLLTYLPNLPNDNDNSSSNLNDTQIDCENRLLAWQSCHVLLILSNHCSNESLCNPYRLALFHFTDTQSIIIIILILISLFNFKFNIFFSFIIKIHLPIFLIQNRYHG